MWNLGFWKKAVVLSVFGMKCVAGWVEGEQKNAGSILSTLVGIDADVDQIGVLGGGEQWADVRNL